MRLRADMDVARPFAHPLGDDGIHDPDHGGLFGHPLEGTDADIHLRGRRIPLHGDIRILHPVEDLLQPSRLGSVGEGDELIDLLFGAYDGEDLHVGEHLRRIDGGDVHGVRHGHREEVHLFSQGNHLIFLRHPEGNERRQRLIHGILVRVVFRDLHLPADLVDNLLFPDDPLPDQILTELQAGPLLTAEGLAELVLGQQTGLDEHFP